MTEQEKAVSYNDNEEDSKENDTTKETIVVELETNTVSQPNENKTEHIEAFCELKAEEEEGVFVGYGSVFGVKDLGNDVVERGAFQKSLNGASPKKIKMLWQHKSDTPIGVYEEIFEDSRGLKVKGKLALGTQGGSEAYELMKMGAIDGMSIGFRADPAKQEYDSKNKRRILKELELMEISLVTFPMNQSARVQAVKGEEMNIRDLEQGMRDAFTFSRSDAKVAAKAVHDAFVQRDAEEESDIELLEAIRQTTTFLTKLTKGEINE